MVSIILYFVLIVVALIFGFILIAGIYMLINKFRDYLILKKIPKDKEKFQQFLVENKENFKIPDKVEISEKEVIEDNERKQRQYREFEKLRGIAKREGGIIGVPKTTRDSPRDKRESQPGSLPNEPIKFVGANQREHKGVKRKLKLDD
jgi:hypothetical protein